MDEQIKKAYKKIHISESAKNRIEMAVVMNEKKEKKKRDSFIQMNRWKIAVAASLSLVLVLPAGVHAAQKIYRYFTTSVTENKYSVDMKMEQEESGNPIGETSNAGNKQQYIKLTVDFGRDYTIEKEIKGALTNADNETALVGYSYKDGFESGKNFWYELQYLDGNQKEILSTYDVSENEVFRINGRKAVYCSYNDVVGSKYSQDYLTCYGQTIYIFIEDYGYILEMAAQKGLAKEDFIHLAERIQISKAASISEASDYVLYSKRQKPAWNVKGENQNAVEQIEHDSYSYKQAKVGETTIKLTDVKVLDSVETLDKDAFITSHFSYKSLVGNNGRLKRYDREFVKYGDGISEPEKSVAKTEKIQPKLVYVTLEVEDATSPSGDGNYQVSSLQFVTKKDGKIYKKGYRDNYNRPMYIDDAFIDRMPCYFEESLGGKSSWFTKIKGNKMTLHFAYLVDEDQIEGMALDLNDWVSSDEGHIYLDISQK